MAHRFGKAEAETGENHVITSKYHRPFSYGFDPTYYPGRLNDPTGARAGSVIFVSDMGDLFGDWVPWAWISDVLAVARHSPHCIFLFLTQNPLRYNDFRFSDNCWLGTTIRGQEDADRLSELVRCTPGKAHRWISFEPLLEPLRAEHLYPDIESVGFAAIGPLNLPGKRGVLPDDWLKSLVAVFKGRPVEYPNTPLWIKSDADYARGWHYRETPWKLPG